MSEETSVPQLRLVTEAFQRELEARLKKSHDIGEGGGDGMDPWQASVESRLGQLHDDVAQVRTDLGGRIDTLAERADSNFKWLLGAFGLGFVSLAGMMIAGYLKLADLIAAIPHH